MVETTPTISTMADSEKESFKSLNVLSDTETFSVLSSQNRRAVLSSSAKILFPEPSFAAFILSDWYYGGYGGIEVNSKKEIKSIQIDNLEVYIDDTVKIVNQFSLRGLPTTILINKNGDEFARILGAIDFDNEKFIEWLKNYD